MVILIFSSLYSKSTAVFEQLQPSYQHVVDLSYLKDGKSVLKFITWTSAFKNETKNIESYCSMRPDKVCKSLELIKNFTTAMKHYNTDFFENVV